MSNLSPNQMRLVQHVFETNPGYVLDFSDNTFRQFFAHLQIEIDDPIYAVDGSSKGKRFKRFLISGSKEKVQESLAELWDYRLTMERLGKIETLDPNLQSDFLKLIDTKISVHGSKNTSGELVNSAMDSATTERMRDSLLALSSLDPQPRGYAFEKFLKSYFDASGLEARDGFRLTGQQIDGSFVLESEVYLLEAKWQNLKVGVSELHGFHGKLNEAAAWTRGLFVSNSGFTEDGLQAFGRGKRLICMDGLDIYETLSRRISLKEVLSQKVRRAGETGRPFVSVRELFLC